MDFWQISFHPDYKKLIYLYNIGLVAQGGFKGMDRKGAEERDALFREIYDLYADSVYRLCISYMKNGPDAEDVMQETFLKFYQRESLIQPKEEAKAWLFVTAANGCKNLLKHWWRKREDIEDYSELIGKEDEKKVEFFSLLMELPVKYRVVVYLYYYEGYNSRQISEMMKKPESTVRTHLKKAKEILRKNF